MLALATSAIKAGIGPVNALKSPSKVLPLGLDLGLWLVEVEVVGVEAVGVEQELAAEGAGALGKRENASIDTYLPTHSPIPFNLPT